MIIKNELPPIYEDIIASGLNPTAYAIYTYGDIIYNPSGVEIPRDIIAHEEVHEKQQQDIGGPDIWWSRFLDDQYFRMDQEAEAYAVQYDFMCKIRKDRNLRNRILLHYAQTLASPTYGSVLSTTSAMKLIKSKVKTK